MTLDRVTDVCAFCQIEGRVEAAIARLRVDFACLPIDSLDCEASLVADIPIRACRDHIDSLVRVATIALRDAADVVKCPSGRR